MERFTSIVNHTLCEVSQDLKPLLLDNQLAANQTVTTQSSSNDSITNYWCTSYNIAVLEVFNELEHIDMHKSIGPDDLPNWVLCDYAFAVSEPLCHILNYSLQNGVMPNIWKAANLY